MKTVCYKVYEITKECQKGILLKTFYKKSLADDFTEKSIYRFIKEDICIK